MWLDFLDEESAINRTSYFAASLSILWVLSVSIIVRADDPALDNAIAPLIAPEADQQGEVAQHIKTLSTGDVLQRRAATSKLLEIGKQALEPLAKEASEGHKETMYHCFDVLTRLLATSDAETSAATKATLTMLTQSQNKSVSLRAKSAIQIGEILGARAAARPAIPFGPGLAPNAQLNMALNAANGEKLRITVTNNDRTIQVERADERIEIRDKAEKDIVVKRTRTVAGQPKTDEFKAADADELKKNHPDAFKLYEQYAQRNGNVLQIGVGNLPGPRPIQIQMAPGLFLGPQLGVRRTPAEAESFFSGPRTIRAESTEGQLEITDENGSKIQIVLTKTIDGKEVVEEFKADDLKQLATEYPAVAKLFEKYTGVKVP